MCVCANIPFRMAAEFLWRSCWALLCVSTSHSDWLNNACKHSCWVLLCVKIFFGLTVKVFVTQLLLLLCVLLSLLSSKCNWLAKHKLGECLTQHCWKSCMHARWNSKGLLVFTSRLCKQNGQCQKNPRNSWSAWLRDQATRGKPHAGLTCGN